MKHLVILSVPPSDEEMMLDAEDLALVTSQYFM
jgi:hypothetical protein